MSSTASIIPGLDALAGIAPAHSQSSLGASGSASDFGSSGVDSAVSGVGGVNSALPPSSSFAVGANSSSGDRSGWQWKKSVSSNDFSRYYFVLSSDELVCYLPLDSSIIPAVATGAPAPPLSSLSEEERIPLDSCSLEIAPESKYNRAFSYDLHSNNGKVYVFGCDGGQEMQDWMLALRKTMLRIRREKQAQASRAKKSAREEEWPLQRPKALPADNANGTLSASASFNSPDTLNASASASSLPSSSSAFTSLASSSSAPSSIFVSALPIGTNKDNVLRHWVDEAVEAKRRKNENENSYRPPKTRNGHGKGEGMMDPIMLMEPRPEDDQSDTRADLLRENQQKKGKMCPCCVIQ